MRLYPPETIRDVGSERRWWRAGGGVTRPRIVRFGAITAGLGPVPVAEGIVQSAARRSRKRLRPCLSSRTARVGVRPNRKRVRDLLRASQERT